MKASNKLILFLLSVLTLACEDVLEEDITSDIVLIIYPQNNTVIESNVVTFQWNDLNGADEYRVQVFAENQSLVVDSLVPTKQFTYPLNAGNYQWRVRGENFAYVSTYSYASNFSVVETSDLENQQVILLNPANNLMTNNPAITFNWQALSAADAYAFELINVTTGSTIVHQLQGLTNESLTLNNSIISTDSEYIWKVKGVNSTSETVYASRNFKLDKVNPNQPVNNLPANNSTQNDAEDITFNWTIPSDVGTIQSNITFTIEFSNTLSFSTILQTSNVNETTFTESFTVVGDYYWRITAKDAAGNIGLSSTPFKFTIN